jgi:large subunit ribosomal protein L19
MSLGRRNMYMPKGSIDHEIIESMQEFSRKLNIKTGDSIKLGITIAEGKGNRMQNFSGVILKNQGKTEATQTITIRRTVQGIGVERVVPINSPLVPEMTIQRSSQVRQSRIYFLRNRSGKATRLKQRFDKAKRTVGNT